MPATFSQQLRYLRTHEPALYESVSKIYRKCLMESNLAPQMDQTDNEAAETPVEKTEITQTNTKGVNDLMDKVHSMVGVNSNKKEGDEIFDHKDDNVETVEPDPAQQADLFGQVPPPADNSVPPQPTEETPAEPMVEEQEDFNLDNLFADEPQTDTPPDQTTDQQTEQPAENPTPPSEEPPAEESVPEGEEDFDLDHMF